MKIAKLSSNDASLVNSSILVLEAVLLRKNVPLLGQFFFISLHGGHICIKLQLWIVLLFLKQLTPLCILSIRINTQPKYSKLFQYVHLI